MSLNYEIVSRDSKVPASFFYSEDKKPNIVQPHFHDSLEIMYLLTGKLYLTVDGHSQTLHAGDTSIINSNEIHSTHAPQWHTTAYVIQIPAAALFEITKSHEINTFHIPLISDPHTSASEHIKVLNLEHTIQTFFDLQQRKADDPYIHIKLVSILNDIVYQLFKNFHNSLSANTGLSKAQIERVTLINRYISEHYHSRLTVPEMADYFGLSENYFSKYFHRTYGMTFGQYLNSIRLDNAYADLVNTTDPITNVADQNGFANYQQFLTKFKELYGCTPSDLRKSSH